MRLMERLAQRLSESRVIDHEAFDSALITEGVVSATGVTVTPDKALGLSAVYAAISIQSETVAVMPAHSVRKVGKIREVVDHQPAWLDPNQGQPNPEQSRFGFFSRLLNSRYTHGNAYALITARDRFAYPSEFYVVHPDDIRPTRFQGRLVYEAFNGRKFEQFNAMNQLGEIIHIKGFDNGGELGLSPIRKEAIGLALAQDEYAARFFAQGDQAGGIVEIPSQTNAPSIDKLVGDWRDAHQGKENAHRTGFLSGGAKWVQTAIPNDDAQFLESRNYSLGEIARMFKMPPHLIGDQTKSTAWGTGLEEQNRMWLIIGLLPEITRLELAFGPALPRGELLRLSPAGLLRGDIKSRFEAYKIARDGGWITGDEIRALEDTAPAGLDEYWQPLNTMDSEDADRKARVDSAKALIQVGFQPEEVAKWLDLPIDHTGTVPVTVYPLLEG